MTNVNIFESKQFNTNHNQYILIVEDDDCLRNNLARYFNLHGYNVTSVADGAHALESIKRHEFQIMLIDLCLPDINGMEILKKINHERLNTACLVITAYASLNSVIDAFHFGAYDYLEKPFPLSELEQKIRHFNLFSR